MKVSNCFGRICRFRCAPLHSTFQVQEAISFTEMHSKYSPSVHIDLVLLLVTHLRTIVFRLHQLLTSVSVDACSVKTIRPRTRFLRDFIKGHVQFKGFTAYDKPNVRHFSCITDNIRFSCGLLMSDKGIINCTTSTIDSCAMLLYWYNSNDSKLF